MNTTTKTPWHLWAVSILGLLWNAGGANDYIQTQTENRDYIGQAAESYGTTADAVIAYYDSWPVWVHAFWAIAIWGAVLGCVLLLLRSRFAFPVFVASFLSIVVTFAYRTMNPLEGVELGAGAIIMTVAIFGVTALLAFYAKVLTNKGVLR